MNARSEWRRQTPAPRTCSNQPVGSFDGLEKILHIAYHFIAVDAIDHDLSSFHHPLIAPIIARIKERMSADLYANDRLLIIPQNEIPVWATVFLQRKYRSGFWENCIQELW